MALSKGFLRPQDLIQQHLIVPGVIMGTSVASALYALFYYFRETIRILTAQFGGHLLIELAPVENFYYNLFYGAIAANIGFYFFIRFVLENSINRRHKKIKRRQRHILNEQSFFMWSFLHAFARWTSLLGIWFLAIPLQFDLDILNDFSWLLVLIPLVFFLNIWPNIFRTIGNKAYKWLLYASVSVVALSLTFASINLIDYQQVNTTLKAQNIETRYALELPRTESRQRIEHRSLVVDIYLVNDTLDTSQPLIFWNHIENRITFDEISDYLIKERYKLFSAERDQLMANLHIDKDVKLEYVNKVKEIIRQTHLSSIQYSTGVKHSKYPSTFLPFKYYGIRQVLDPAYYPELEAFLDTAEHVDFSKYILRLPESVMYRNPEINKYNRIEIQVTPQSVLLNKENISEERLGLILYKFVKTYAPDYAILYDADSSITYGKYIEYLDLIHATIDKLRHELSYELHGEAYDPPFLKNEPDTIHLKYPKTIIEWTPEEKRLKELMKKADR